MRQSLDRNKDDKYNKEAEKCKEQINKLVQEYVNSN